MTHGQRIPTGQAIEIANTFLRMMRERGTLVRDEPTGLNFIEFQWPRMEEELRTIEPHTAIIMNYLRTTGHVIVYRRGRPTSPGGGTSPSIYRTDPRRMFTENDLRLARLSHAREQANRKTKKEKNRSTPPSSVPPSPALSEPTPVERPRVKVIAPPNVRPGVHTARVSLANGEIKIEVLPLSPARHGGHAKAGIDRTVEATRAYAALAPGGQLDAVALLGAVGDVVNDLRRRVLALEQAGTPRPADLKTNLDAAAKRAVEEFMKLKFGGK